MTDTPRPGALSPQYDPGGAPPDPTAPVLAAPVPQAEPDPSTQPDPDRDSHVAFPDLDATTRPATPTVPGRPRLSHTTAFPGGHPVRRPVTPVRPPGTGRRWGVWVAGATALAVVLGVSGGVHVGVSGGSSSVSVEAGPGPGYDPGTDPGFGNDAGDASPADPGPASLPSWVELADAPPLGGTAPLTGRHRQVHPMPPDVQQLRVEVVGDGRLEASTGITVGGQQLVDTVVATLPWVAEAAVGGAGGPTAATPVQVEVQPTGDAGTLECRIYAGGTLVSVVTADGPVTCAVTLPARSG